MPALSKTAVEPEVIEHCGLWSVELQRKLRGDWRAASVT